MKLALFEDAFGNEATWDHVPITEGWIQTTGWTDVQFPPLSDAEKKLNAELMALTKRHQTFDDDFRRQRKALEEERAALLKTGT